MKIKKIILIGGGGHCCSVIDVILTENKFEIIGIIDKEENIGKSVLGFPIIGSDNDIANISINSPNFIITIGQIKNNQNRVKLYNILKSLNLNLPVIVSPKAYVSKYSEINEGTVIMHNAFINARAVINHNCIINTNSIIEHDVIIGEHSHVSTGAIINGECIIGANSFIGSNSVIINGIKLGQNSIIGAGSVVISDLPGNAVYAGIPAKKITNI